MKRANTTDIQVALLETHIQVLGAVASSRGCEKSKKIPNKTLGNSVGNSVIKHLLCLINWKLVNRLLLLTQAIQ